MRDFGEVAASVRREVVMNLSGMTSNPATTTTAAAPASPINVVVLALDQDRDQLAAMISHLEDKLAPVLGHSNPHPPEAPDPDCPGTSSVVAGLWAVHGGYQVLQRRLAALLDYLEV